LKRFVPVAASLVGLGLASLTLSGGCSGDRTPPVLTDAQKEQVKKEEEAQASANDAAAKVSTQRRSVNPP